MISTAEIIVSIAIIVGGFLLFIFEGAWEIKHGGCTVGTIIACCIASALIAAFSSMIVGYVLLTTMLSVIFIFKLDEEGIMRAIQWYVLAELFFIGVFMVIMFVRCDSHMINLIQ